MGFANDHPEAGQVAYGFGLASVPRSFIRQRSNVMVVGGIHNFETAQIAIQAALTGHRVLSTVTPVPPRP